MTTPYPVDDKWLCEQEYRSIFEAYVDTETFSKALAEIRRLNQLQQAPSQEALTQCIKLLEELFYKEHSGFEITPYMLHVLKQAKAAKVPDRPVEQPRINVPEIIDKLATRIMAWRQQGVTRSAREEAIDYVEYVLAELRYGSTKREISKEPELTISVAKMQPIETAPKDGTAILVQTVARAFLIARWENGFQSPEDEPCQCWVEVFEETAPKSWTDGVCWARNEDDEPSDPPVSWIAVPTLSKIDGAAQ